MTKYNFSMKDLIEAGVHFGHHIRRWNPKMAPYIYGTKDKIHIINLEKTVPLMLRALKAIEETVGSGGKVLFVATKKQAQDAVKEIADKTGQFYMNHRWLGGTLTNWKTVSKSISRMKRLEKTIADADKGNLGLTKKEILYLTREYEKLNNSLGGIANMNGRPDILFVIDVVKEKIALKEAQKLEIPIIAICDTNGNPEEVDYPIPGNDDAIRALKLYLDLVSQAVLNGLKQQLEKSGKDLGAMEKPMEESKSVKKASPKNEKEDSSDVGKANEKTAVKESKETVKKTAKKSVETDDKKEEKKAAKKTTAKKSTTKKSPAKETTKKPAEAKTEKKKTTKAKKGE